jgi:phage terminase large subunit GpA-like protein
VPQAVQHVTIFIDVGASVFFWVACGWEEGFTGHVLDYGAYPDQKRAFWQANSAPVPLSSLHPGSREVSIQAGLEKLATELLHRDWPRAGGGQTRVGKMLVDMGYKGEQVAAVKHRLAGDTFVLAKGIGLTVRNKPFEEYKRKAGEQYGWHWYIPNVRGTREFPHVAADVNWWKTHVHAALAAPLGERGGLTLFGPGPEDQQAGGPRIHELFAEHVANSEIWTDVKARGRTVREWNHRPSKPDNHWLDCLVGCAVAASLLGVQSDIQAAQGAQRTRRRYTQADMNGGRT